MNREVGCGRPDYSNLHLISIGSFGCLMTGGTLTSTKNGEEDVKERYGGTLYSGPNVFLASLLNFCSGRYNVSKTTPVFSMSQDVD